MAVDSLVVLVTYVVAAWLLWAAWKISYVPGRRKDFDVIPGGPRVPILGNLIQIYRECQAESFRVFLKYVEKYAKEGLALVQLLNYPVLFVCSAKTAEVILSSKKYMDKAPEYKHLQPWLGTGLLTSTGSKWHSRRRLLTPSFHFRILNDFVPVFNEQAEIFCNKLKEKADGRSSFDIFPFVTLCTLDIICETAMGKKMEVQSNDNSPYVQAVKRMSEIVSTRFKAVWYWNDTIFNLSPLGREQKKCLKILHSMTDQVILERHFLMLENEETDANNNQQQQTTTTTADTVSDDDSDIYFRRRRRLAFLDTLLLAEENGKKLNFLDIREEVDTFMFEGHDTTSVATNWAIYLLGHHLHVQTKLHDEMNEIFGESDRPATYEDLKKMTYLECVVKETLRLYPSVPGIARVLSGDAMLGSYNIPKGTTALIVPYCIHRDPDIFPDPEKFDPGRFSPENSSDRHPYAYIPFSAGLRNCIGQRFAMLEEKVILSSVVRKFWIKSVTPRSDMVLIPELILRPAKGIQVILTKRK